MPLLHHTKIKHEIIISYPPEATNKTFRANLSFKAEPGHKYAVSHQAMVAAIFAIYDRNFKHKIFTDITMPTDIGAITVFFWRRILDVMHH